MKKSVVLIIILLISSLAVAQERQERKQNNRGVIQDKEPKKTTRGKIKKKTKDKPPITAYKIIDRNKNTTYLDTTLTIQKDYNFNYLRRDDFGLQPLNNVGQTHSSLIKVEERNHVLPFFGARARHFNFMEAGDILYYNVPTPLTELYFKTTFEQGQQLDAFLTINTSPQLNLSIAYKGIRSLGKYKHALTSTGNFRTTANYNTKNGRYQAQAHFVTQDLLNEENGGLSFIPSEEEGTSGIDQYLSLGLAANNRRDFADRAGISVNFEDAESILRGKRFYLDHQYNIIKKTDSSTTNLALGHTLDITDKSFQFDQAAANMHFGASYQTSALADKVALEDFTNHIYLNFDNSWFGNLKLQAGNSDYNYGYNTILQLLDPDTGAERNITNRIKGDVYTVGGNYKKTYKGFKLFADGMTIVSGDFDGNYFNVGAGYEYKKKYGAQLSIHHNAAAPNYNFLLNQSAYINYNWHNDFKNIETRKVKLKIKAHNFATLEGSYNTIDNHTYFTKNTDSITVPQQYTQTIELLKLKLSQNLKFKWFGIDNTIQYQKVSSGEQVYKVPEIVTRNTLYYHDHWFRRALYLQTGVTFKYYSAYTADGYDPVLSEFYVQSQSEQAFFEENNHTFGGFPQFDIFFNAKIRQTRIYFKVENFGEAFKQNNEFSAPGYAPRDAVLRFGLVWNFFL